jgi:hypothetical protein
MRGWTLFVLLLRACGGRTGARCLGVEAGMLPRCGCLYFGEARCVALPAELAEGLLRCRRPATCEESPLDGREGISASTDSRSEEGVCVPTLRRDASERWREMGTMLSSSTSSCGPLAMLLRRELTLLLRREPIDSRGFR